MKRSAFDENRDQRVANESGTERRLMCTANGCPNRWSTSIGNLCRWHAASEPHHWPEITREQQDAETDRARAAGMDRSPPFVAPMSTEQKRAIALRLQFALDAAKKNPRAWIDRLRAREAAGEPMSAGQKHALEQMRTPLSGMDYGDLA